jgi:hypothetical protein
MTLDGPVIGSWERKLDGEAWGTLTFTAAPAPSALDLGDDASRFRRPGSAGYRARRRGATEGSTSLRGGRSGKASGLTRSQNWRSCARENI